MLIGVAVTASGVAVTAAAPVAATGSPPTSEAETDAMRVTLSNILELHHAVGEFVGARLALRHADGTVTEVSAGTPTQLAVVTQPRGAASGEAFSTHP
jgi:hypothetical protein